MFEPTVSDHVLLTAWRQGGTRAGELLFKRHHDAVVCFFQRRLSPGPISDDLVQDTFVGLLEGIRRFRGESSFKTLLLAIAQNKLRRHLRDRCRAGRDVLCDSGTLASPCMPPSEVIARSEQSTRLAAALARVPGDTHTLMKLYYWENLKLDEIAGIMGLSRSAVKVRLHRARKLLRAKLADSGWGRLAEAL